VINILGKMRRGKASPSERSGGYAVPLYQYTLPRPFNGRELSSRLSTCVQLLRSNSTHRYTTRHSRSHSTTGGRRVWDAKYNNHPPCRGGGRPPG